MRGQGAGRVHAGEMQARAAGRRGAASVQTAQVQVGEMQAGMQAGEVRAGCRQGAGEGAGREQAGRAASRAGTGQGCRQGAGRRGAASVQTAKPAPGRCRQECRQQQCPAPPQTPQNLPLHPRLPCVPESLCDWGGGRHGHDTPSLPQPPLAQQHKAGGGVAGSPAAPGKGRFGVKRQIWRKKVFFSVWPHARQSCWQPCWHRTPPFPPAGGKNSSKT